MEIVTAGLKYLILPIIAALVVYYCTQKSTSFSLINEGCQPLEVVDVDSARTTWNCGLTLLNETDTDGLQSLECSISVGNFWGAPDIKTSGVERKRDVRNLFDQKNESLKRAQISLLKNEKVKFQFKAVTNDKKYPGFSCRIFDF